MRKNKFLLTALATLGLLASSCEDAYNITQPGEVNDPDVVYTSIDNLEYGLNGVYAVFSTASEIEFTSIFTDETSIGIQNGGQGLISGLYNFNLNSGSDAPQAIWQSNYLLINFANRLMVAAEKFKTDNPYYWEVNPDDTQDVLDEKLDVTSRYDNVIAQLYGLRAYAYMDLVSWFSTDPADDSALGVMLLDFVPADDYSTFLPRVTNGEIYALIDSDIQKALDIYSTSASPILTSTYYVSEDFLYALKLRELVYRKKYQDAVTLFASNEIPMGTSPYPLQNTLDGYISQLGDVTAEESIFKIACVTGDFQVGSYWNSSSSTVDGAPFFEISRSLYNAYGSSDIRMQPDAIIDSSSLIMSAAQLAIASNGTYRNNDILVVNKYPGNEAQGDRLLNDLKVFTIGELVLLRAEALAGIGNLNGTATTSAAYWVRRLRNYRTGINTAVTFADQTDAFSVIQDERRKELAFMGMRYLDIKRLGPVTGKGVDRYSLDCAPYGSCTLSATDYRFTMPIPNTEIIANPSIQGQQNPGY
ncbi:RagB/SusD family nutrient uptake outer membrane protein [Flavobacterium sp. RHBU_3]|uniref:RagB/SusD family nutrient uptake outer membrane protein n=1 Tax=Flavobacterium sp. RHBU_3 TaxID=3391184 RepID=UPI003984EF94